MKRTETLVLLCSALLVAGLYHEVVRWLFRAWLDDPYYSHGLLLLPAGAFLVWLKRKEIYRAEPEDWLFLPLCLLCFGFSLYLLGTVLHLPTLLAFSLLPVLAGFSLVFLGKRAKPLLFPVFLLATAIPFQAFEALEVPLQNLSASAVSAIFGVLGMPSSISGNCVTLAGNTYWIAPACSGLNRIMPLFALTAVVAYLLGSGRLLAWISLLALVVPFALASNILRLFVTLLIGTWFGVEVAVGFAHDCSSVLFFLVALVLILAAAGVFKLKLRLKLRPL